MDFVPPCARTLRRDFNQQFIPPMMRLPHLSLVCCLAASPVAAEPVISEFMASNQNGITDENGDRPDWIEIRNPDADAGLDDWLGA